MLTGAEERELTERDERARCALLEAMGANDEEIRALQAQAHELHEQIALLERANDKILTCAKTGKFASLASYLDFDDMISLCTLPPTDLLGKLS